MGTASRWLWAAVLATGLGACTTALPPERTQALGPPYNEAVKQAYLQLAAQEGLVPIPATSYREKARAAMLGDMVWPDKVGAHPGIPPEVRPEALAVRERLVTALDANATERAPEASAEAVASFDCWLRELEDDTGSTDCQQALMEALPEVETAAAAVPEDYQAIAAKGRRGR